MERKVKILLLEDNLNDVELIHHQISKSAIKFQFKHVSEYNEFSKAIDDYIPDLILSDYSLGSFTGLDALELANQKCPLTPFIIVTGTINEETAAETIKKGAWDYVVKERLPRLDSAMKNALELKEEKDKRAIDKVKLKISEERYELAIEGSQDGIWDWDLLTNEVYFSSRWKSMLGYKDHEIENDYKIWEALLHPEDKEFTLAELNRHLKKETPFYKVEARLKCKDGSYKWIFARGKSMDDQNGDPYRIAGSHTDISERKLMEEKLIHAKEKAEESDKLKSAFLANMSHEIRTPMNGILGFAGLLKQANLSGESQQNYIEIIEKSGKRMLNIINDIVSISKIESGLTDININNVNINNQIEYVYTFFKPEAEAKGIELSFNCSLPSSKSIIKTDHEKFLSILTNLVKNAIKYTEKGNIELGYILKKDAEHAEVEFYIKDTGIGIESDRQKAIFERFIQADIEDKMARQGAGLGLSISKAYAEMLDGKLWVKSEVDKGSTFYFTIPYNTELITKDEIKIDISAEDINNLNKSIKILIVEDDETSALLLLTMLEKINCEILQARNGVEAVEHCRKNPDLDIVLMDIKMPIMDGYDATCQIRQFNKNVNIIAQTAHALSEDSEKAYEVGCDGHLTKPIIKSELFSVIKQNLIN